MSNNLGPAQPHDSHNFSDHDFKCYGCGCDLHSVRAYAVCSSPDDVGKQRMGWLRPTLAPEMPAVKGDEIDLQLHPAFIHDPKADGVAQYKPLPPVAHDPLNMQPNIDLLSLYPKLADVEAANVAVYGKSIPDPIERALRQALHDAAVHAKQQLSCLQTAMRVQREHQTAFNKHYADVEAILAKFPELLKP